MIPPLRVWSNTEYSIMRFGQFEYQLESSNGSTIATFKSCEGATRYVYMEFL